MVSKLIQSVMEHRYDSDLNYYAALCVYKLLNFLRVTLSNPKKISSKKFKRVFGRELVLENPRTLNEKIQWLKLNDHKDYYTQCADKYCVREWLSKRFDDNLLIPLVYHTRNYLEINPKNILQYPCIVKANHSSKDYEILRDPSDVDWTRLQRKCRWWLQRDYYNESQEWQYKNIERQIVVEELLQTSDHKIPNDYKLHYMNGELQFIYVSVDREGDNSRNIYDKDWQPLYFDWSGTNKNAKSRRGIEIPAPKSFEKMKDIGAIIAKEFPYVRIDYYDVEGKLYFGEITLHHGGGFDVFIPESYDLYYGNLLDLGK